MESTHFWLIRHGETEWNANRRLQGWLDIPLSEHGVQQAHQLATWLRAQREPVFDIVLSSDLSRAAETALLATSGMELEIITSPQLRERNYGVYQGMDWAALTDDLAARNVNLRDPQQSIEEGESFQEFADRIVRTFDAYARQYAGKNVLVFAHGGVVDVVWRKANGHSLTVKREGTILNTSVNVFDVYPDGAWRMGTWNQVGHLDAPTLDDVMHT